MPAEQAMTGHKAGAVMAVPVHVLAGVLLGFVAVMHLLLGAFLGLPWPILAAGAVLAAIIIAACARLRGWSAEAVPVRTLGFLLLFSLALLILGGEGRLFYANTDWQVRNAVLRDLVVMPWPWVYQTTSGLELLRLPLGMYLLPGLVGKLCGERAAEFALLAQNALLLTGVFGLAATLYRDNRERLTTLFLFLGFSGLDILGQAIVGKPLIGHAEGWAGLQYSAPITLAFWVPQHMLAGWIGTILFLLWREQRAPLAALLLYAPLGLLLSPLSIIGLLPLAAYAGLQTLWTRRLRPADIILPLLATLLAIPSMLYLAAGSDEVGGGFAMFHWLVYVAFFALEIVPFLAILWLARGHWRFDRLTVWIVVILLLLLPFGRIGGSTDFMMRASIPELAVLALLMADILQRLPQDEARLRVAQVLAVGTFAVGAAVPIGEIGRAVMLPRAPASHCSYFGIVPGGAATYVARLDRLPAPIRPAHPAIIALHDPATCWDGPWPDGRMDR